MLTRPRKSHIWQRQTEDWYREPSWVAERLFDVESFTGEIVDPCCGSGNIVEAARARGHCAAGWDLVDRGYKLNWQGDFFKNGNFIGNFVFNPPFAVAPDFIAHAVNRMRYKVCALFPVPRLNAAHHWLGPLPLARIRLLTPRPSMPPGEVVARGEKIGGGKVDYCWLIFTRSHIGATEISWLHRGERNGTRSTKGFEEQAQRAT